MAMQILTLNQISLLGLDRLPRDRYEIASEFSHPDAILLRSHRLAADAIPDSVLAVARAGAGVNNIPVDACTRRGIPVFNTPGANANAVKELVAAGLLLGSRGILAGADYVAGLRACSDKAELNATLEANKKRFKGREITGKRLGVVGLGAIGSLVADMALTLGMEVVGYDPALSVDAAWRLPSEVQKAEALTTLFSRCDFVTLHLPVLDSTRGLVNAELLAVMPPHACLLNFAREEIIDEDALIEALDAGRLRGYIADFPTPRLIGREDVILTPHLGASTAEAEDNCAIMAADQLRDFLENGNIRNAVNFPTLQLERVSGCRLAVSNDNVPRTLNRVLALLAEQNINVIDMLNRSRDQLAYNLIDIETMPPQGLIDAMRDLDGVTSVRLIGDCN
jgi:D-3-phosphoglycerate dehydrogenase